MAKISAMLRTCELPHVATAERAPRSKNSSGAFTLEPPGVVHIWPYPTLPAGVDTDLARTGF